MPAVKPISHIAEKWARVTPQRATDYEAGIQAPRRDWAQATVAATERYAAGVQSAIQNKLFSKGVQKAGSEKWKRKATEVGPRRFSEGVQVAAPDYEKGFAPYRDVIEKTQLPPRFAKGDPRNIDRVRAMAMALAEAKRK
jgi:hypothetical protein